MNQKLNRRQFIKTGSMGLVATCLIPKFLSATKLGLNPFSTNPVDMTYDAISSHFQVSEAMMRELTGALVEIWERLEMKQAA